MPGAEEAFLDIMSKQNAIPFHHAIIEQSKRCHGLRYTPSSFRSWDRKSDHQKSMQDLLATLKAFGEFDPQFDYGVRDGSIYLPHEGDRRPKASKINRQLVEWISEGQRNSLPTFEDALEEVKDTGSAYNTLGVALRHVSKFREMTEDELKAYWEWKEKIEAKANQAEDEEEYRVSGSAPSITFDESRTGPGTANDLLTQ
jgi:hypothetical protein